MTDKSHEFFMAKALRLAHQGVRTTTPNPNVGCVIVNQGQVVGQGYHHKAGTPHAEVHALQQAGHHAQGATAYVTLEPCSHFGKTPPCAQALIESGVDSVICAMQDPNPLVAGKGLHQLERAGIQTQSGVLASQAEWLNRGFLKRMRQGIPWVQLKMASSLDGATALSNGESQWITSPEARLDVQTYRAEACAVVTGIGTVLADDPSLNVRLPTVERQPIRIILDTHLQMPVTARMLSLPGRTLVLHGPRFSETHRQALMTSGGECVLMPVDARDSRLDLNSVLSWCGQQGLNRLWVESGATLAGEFFQQQLVDEVILYQSMQFLGSDTRSVLKMTLPTLQAATQLHRKDMRFVGPDVRWTLLTSDHD